MFKRVFAFFLSFFFFIGGTLATAHAASVEAVDVSDSDVVLLNYSNDSDGGFGFFLYSSGSETYNYYSSSDVANSTFSISNAKTNSFTSFIMNFGFDSSSNSSSTNITIVFKYSFFDSIGISYSDISSVIVRTSPYTSSVGLPGRVTVGTYTVNSSNLSVIDHSSDKSVSFVFSGIDLSASAYSTLQFEFRGLSAELPSSSISGIYVPAISVSDGIGDLEETNNLISSGNGLLSNIWSSITALPQQIIELFISAMESLFIPSDDYFSTKFNELYVLFDDKLGFLMYPTEVFSSFVSALQISSDGFVIDFPAFSIDVGGVSYQVWDDYTFNFDDIKNNFPEIFSAAEIIFTVILCGYSINLIITYYDVVVWGSASTALVDQGGRDDY